MQSWNTTGHVVIITAIKGTNKEKPMKKIEIRLYSLRELYMKYQDRLSHEAERMSDENLKAVDSFREAVLHHISREPIPKENKEYLREAVEKEFRNVRLYPVWPRKKN